MAQRLENFQRQSAYPLGYRKEKGSILIITLWSLFLLATFAICLGGGVRQKLSLIKRLEERNKLHYIAEAGIRKAMTTLEGEANGHDSLNDEWSSNAALFKGMVIGDGIANIYYECLDEKNNLGGIRYGIMDEERKININNADRHVLKRLFILVLGFDDIAAQELAASIVDWRDEDSYLSIPLGSAEDSYYRSLTHAYESKDARFDVLDELLLVRYVSPEVYEKIKNFVTIYGNGKININTASKPVLMALGLNEKIVDRIMLYRQGEDGIIATADDGVFTTHFTIVPKLSQNFAMFESEVVQLSNIVNRYLVTNSNNFMIKSKASFRDRNATVEIVAVTNKNQNILYWRES